MTIVQEVDLDPGEVYHELHDPEHIALVIDGLADSIQKDLDSVGGTESLTKSQLYLQGALLGSGSVRLSSVEGNESFFSAVGDGVKKAWEYIKKMFAGLWNFFFGSKEGSIDAKITEAETKVNQNKETISKIADGSASDEVVNKTVSNLKSEASKIDKDPKASSSAKEEAKEIIKIIEEAQDKPKAEKVKVIKTVVPKIVRTMEENRFLVSKTATFVKNNADYAETYLGADKSSEVKNSELSSTYSSLRKEFLGSMQKIKGLEVLKQGKEASTLEQATIVQKELGNILKDLRDGVKVFRGEKNKIDSLFREIQSKINSSKEEDKKDLLEKLNDLKVISALLSKMHMYMLTICSSISNFSFLIGVTFGIPSH